MSLKKLQKLNILILDPSDFRRVKHNKNLNTRHVFVSRECRQQHLNCNFKSKYSQIRLIIYTLSIEEFFKSKDKLLRLLWTTNIKNRWLDKQGNTDPKFGCLLQTNRLHQYGPGPGKLIWAKNREVVRRETFVIFSSHW